MCHFNEVGRKIIFIFFLILVVLPKIKLLDMMKLVSKFLFHLRIYGVNFKIIDNGSHSTTI